MPIGLARFQLNSLLFSFGKDSGKTKYPYIQLIMAKAADAKNGNRISYFPKIPPSAGPIIKPIPKATPIIPKF